MATRAAEDAKAIQENLARIRAEEAEAKRLLEETRRREDEASTDKKAAGAFC